MGAKYLDPDGLAFFADEQLYFTGLFSFGKTAIIIPKIFSPDPVLHAGGLGHFFVHADAGQFRSGIGAPRHPCVICFAGKMKDCVADNNTAFVSGSMGKLVAANNVSCSVNMLLTGVEPLVHLNSFSAVFYANVFKAKSLCVDGAAEGHKNFRGVDINIFTGCGGDGYLPTVSQITGFVHCTAKMKGDSFLLKHLHNLVSHVLVFLAQDLTTALQNRNLTAKTAEGLGHLYGNGTGTKNDE